MSFIAQCIFCKHKVKVPDEALGASVRCKKCDNSFTLAPIEEAPSEQVLTRFRRHAPAAACGATDVASPGTGLLTDQASAPLPSHNGPADHAVAQEIPDPARTLRRAIHLAGAMGLVLGGAGLACASFAAFDGLTVPLSIAGVVVGL